MNCTPAVDEASTAGSLLLASMVEVESGLTCSSFEAWLGRYVKRKVGGEMNITSESVDITGLQGANDRKSGSRFEKTARMSSLEKQTSEVSAIESGRSGIINCNQTLSHLAKNKKSSNCNQNVSIKFREK